MVAGGRADNPLVSVIIPTYNRACLLPDAMESVFAQTFTNWELIVVDDGSSDETGRLMESYGDRVRYIRQNNQGPSAARNKGIHNARGELIAFLDSDDRWLPHKLEKQMARLQNARSLGLVSCASHICDKNGGIIDINRADPFCSGSVKREIFIRNVFPTSTVMVRKECFRRVGGFNLSYRFAEDWDMWLRIAARYEIDYIDEVLAAYKIKAAQSITENATTEELKCWEAVIDDNRRLFGSPAARTLFLRRAKSWYYFYLSYTAQTSQDKSAERQFLLDSIMWWPFFHYKRYLALIRTFLNERFYLLYRKMKGY